MSSRSTTAESAAESFMQPKVAHGGTAFPYHETASGTLRTKPETEDEKLGRDWGMKSGTAHQMKHKAIGYVVDVIRARRAAGDFDGAARYAAPLEEVVAALPCPNAELREGVKDAEEDVLETRYRMAPSAETARPLIAKRMEYLGALMDDTRRIATKEGLQL